MKKENKAMKEMKEKIDRIEVFNDKRVKIHFTFEDVLKSYETG